jgi:hypothetical protein
MIPKMIVSVFASGKNTRIKVNIPKTREANERLFGVKYCRKDCVRFGFSCG